jgi:hypothetical protein
LVIGISCAYFPLRIFYEINPIRNWMMANYKEPEQGWNQWTDFFITVFATLVFALMDKLVHFFCWNFFYRNCKEEKDEQIRLAKT